MFKKNFSHLQIPLTSHIDELPEKLRIRIENSWSGVFYRDFFCRIDETPFEVLYADCPSRPNVPVNVLVALEFLKAGNGWTDEQLFEEFAYNIQVRYAVGYRQLGEGHFELRTLYNFRERLSRYSQRDAERSKRLGSTCWIKFLPKSPMSKLKLTRSKPVVNGWTAPRSLPISGKWDEFNYWSQSYSASHGC